jgi:hypothetical protein
LVSNPKNPPVANGCGSANRGWGNLPLFY